MRVTHSLQVRPAKGMVEHQTSCDRGELVDDVFFAYDKCFGPTRGVHVVICTNIFIENNGGATATDIGRGILRYVDGEQVFIWVLKGLIFRSGGRLK